jgi:hypothetical protein
VENVARVPVDDEVDLERRRDNELRMVAEAIAMIRGGATRRMVLANLQGGDPLRVMAEALVGAASLAMVRLPSRPDRLAFSIERTRDG